MRLLALILPVLVLCLLGYGVYQLYAVHMDDPWSFVFGLIQGMGLAGLVLAVLFSGRRPIERGPFINSMISFGYVFILWMVLLVLFRGVVGVVGLIFSIQQPWVWRGPLILASIPFLALVYGILFGKYNYTLEKVELQFADLPKAFDGLRLVQISDAHSGTWDSKRGVQKGIDLINQQRADIIIFTGDLVNRSKEEINPFMEQFASLTAPLGKYAILGNHDYYGQPRARTHRQAYYDDFFKKYKAMGFDLILNDHRKIKKGSSEINVVGVENWGTGRFFPKRGDLDLATRGLKTGDFTILLSHDPSHWDMHAIGHPHHFHLTLSGHTHGMQFGINLPFLKWSPVQYRYRQWMGLYERLGQYLYVNRGFGMLAYAGRVGMSPEVTLMTLRAKS